MCFCVSGISIISNILCPQFNEMSYAAWLMVLDNQIVLLYEKSIVGDKPLVILHLYEND